MKAIFAALLICLGCNAFAECAAPTAANCGATTASPTTSPALPGELTLIKTGALTTAAPSAATGDLVALRTASPSMARRATLSDVPAQAQPSSDRAGEPLHPWSDSSLLLVGVALMTGIALRRWLAGSR